MRGAAIAALAGLGLSLAAPAALPGVFPAGPPRLSAAGSAPSWIDVRSWSARGDNVTDDTAAIRNAIAAIPRGQHGTVYFPRGVYVVAPAPHGDAFNPRGGISFRGDGPGRSVIRVKDGVGDFRGIFYNSTGILGDATFSGLTFDGNSPGNPARRAEDVRSGRIAVSPGAGPNVLIENCEFSNFNGTWVVSDVGPGARIVNNTFRNLGADAPYDHDFSALYAHAADVRIVGNRFYGAPLVRYLGSNRTAIEIHGDNVVVERNMVDNMVIGVNLTGIYERNSANLLVRGNVLNNVMVGIALWSGRYGSHTSGYGLDGVRIDGNEIRVKQTGHADVIGTAGIVWNELNDLPARDIAITNNTIRYDLSVPPRNTAAPVEHSGILLFSQTKPPQAIHGLRISGNTIDSPETAGILVLMDVTDAAIAKNTIVNPGSTMTGYAIGIGIRGGAATGPVAISGNRISDDRASRRMQVGIWVGVDAVPAGRISLVDNELSVRDTATPGTWYYIHNSGRASRPLVMGAVPDFGRIHTENPYAAGSELRDMATGRLFRAVADSAAAPGAQWKAVPGP